MVETYARLLCPECGKQWESSPNDLPEPSRTYHCPNCHASRPLAEFARTDRDLQNIRNF